MNTYKYEIEQSRPGLKEPLNANFKLEQHFIQINLSNNFKHFQTRTTFFSKKHAGCGLLTDAVWMGESSFLQVGFFRENESISRLSRRCKK
jgi:hypothetical protein